MFKGSEVERAVKLGDMKGRKRTVNERASGMIAEAEAAVGQIIKDLLIMLKILGMWEYQLFLCDRELGSGESGNRDMFL